MPPQIGMAIDDKDSNGYNLYHYWYLYLGGVKSVLDWMFLTCDTDYSRIRDLSNNQRTFSDLRKFKIPSTLTTYYFNTKFSNSFNLAFTLAVLTTDV